MNSSQSETSQESKIKPSREERQSAEDSKNEKQTMNEEVPDIKQSQVQQTRQIIRAHQLQKLAKNDNPEFLVIVRQTNDTPQKRRKEEINGLQIVAINAAAHGITEGEKRKIYK